jgi:hypothetical protein
MAANRSYNEALSTTPLLGGFAMQQRGFMQLPRWVLGLLVLAGCSRAEAPSNRADPPLRVAVFLHPPQSCRVVVGGRSFVLPYEARALEAALAAARPRSRRAAIVGDAATPFRCFGNAAYHSQRAGFTVTDVQAQGAPAPVPR